MARHEDRMNGTLTVRRRMEKPATRRALASTALLRQLKLWTLRASGPCLILLAWQVAGSLLQDDTLISKPTLVWAAMVDQLQSGQLLDDSKTTLFELMAGFLFACGVGLPLGFAMGRYRLVEYAMDPYIWFFYCAPVIVFFPILSVWFGLGGGATIVLTFLFAVFPIVANTVTGVKDVDRSLIRAARAFGANELQVFTQVIAIAAVPAVASGLRLGLGRALIGAVVGEFFGSNSGLGFRIAFYATSIQVANMFVPVFVVIVIGVALMQFLASLERRMQNWRT
jgi:ABC-type nitrate/sulfonate/bicarbonate transport system permease component